MSLTAMFFVIGAIFTGLGILQLTLKKAFISGGRGGFVTTNKWLVYPMAGGQTLLGLGSLGAGVYYALFV